MLCTDVSPPPSNLYVEALNPSVTIFGDKAFNKVFKMKSGHKNRTLIPQDLHPYKKRKRHKASFSHYESTEKRPWVEILSTFRSRVSHYHYFQFWPNTGNIGQVKRHTFIKKGNHIFQSKLIFEDTFLIHMICCNL